MQPGSHSQIHSRWDSYSDNMEYVLCCWLLIVYILSWLIAGQLVEHNISRERKFDSGGHIQSAKYIQHSVAEMGCILPSLQPRSHFIPWKQKHLQTARLDAFLMAANGQVKVYATYERRQELFLILSSLQTQDLLESCVTSWDQTPIEFEKTWV